MQTMQWGATPGRFREINPPVEVMGVAVLPRRQGQIVWQLAHTSVDRQSATPISLKKTSHLCHW